MMANRKQYYKLDEIGFVGTQDKRSNAQVKKDIEDTVQYIRIKGRKLGSRASVHPKTARQLAKTK